MNPAPGRTAFTSDVSAALTTAPSLAQYVEGLRAGGVPVCAGSRGTYWVSSPERIVRRLPTINLGTPAAGEVDEVLRCTGGVVASYVTESAADRAANAWLYVCADPTYSLRDRPPAMQRNVRRALRELVIASVTPEELLLYGEAAFCDTRRRTGLNDGTPRGFRQYFADRIDQPGRAYLGAWRGGRLVAFLTIVRVEEWAELGSFSMTSTLGYRPNDALMYAALSGYLGRRGCHVVSYGLSSIQARSNVAGLHRFKQKVGFVPVAVHRSFVLHPSLRRFANPATLMAAHWAVNRALNIQPRSRRLKKLEGMLAYMRGRKASIQVAGGEPHGRRPGHRPLPISAQHVN